MNVWITSGLLWLAASGTALAQTATALSDRAYVEAVAQSAFGNVTSQSYGGELGIAIARNIKIFLDAGQVRDASASALGLRAQVIAGFLSRTQTNVTYQVKQPVTFGLAGVRYGVVVGDRRFEPYLIGGAGVARVRRDVSFAVANQDVTNSLEQLGVALGTDISGAETKPMLTAGGGVAWPFWQYLVVDVQYRYGRVFTAGQGTNVNRAGVGMGVRF